MYAAPVPEFLLSSRTMIHAEQVSRSGRSGLEIILITGGSVAVTWDGGSASFKGGDAVLFEGLARARTNRLRGWRSLPFAIGHLHRAALSLGLSIFAL